MCSVEINCRYYCYLYYYCCLLVNIIIIVQCFLFLLFSFIVLSIFILYIIIIHIYVFNYEVINLYSLHILHQTFYSPLMTSRPFLASSSPYLTMAMGSLTMERANWRAEEPLIVVIRILIWTLERTRVMRGPGAMNSPCGCCPSTPSFLLRNSSW